MLIVHHGLFWGGLQTATGAHYRKLKLAIENDLAVYSVHLPLDAHPQSGNNVLLCNALDLPETKAAFLEDRITSRGGARSRDPLPPTSNKRWAEMSILPLADLQSRVESEW